MNEDGHGNEEDAEADILEGDEEAQCEQCRPNEDVFYDNDNQYALEVELDEENGHGFRKRSKFPLFDARSKEVSFCLGMIFKDKEHFKGDVRKYSIRCRKELRWKKNAESRFKVVCNAGAKCPWSTSATYNRRVRGLQVHNLVDKHNCPVSFSNRMCNKELIAEHFEGSIRYHPKIKLKEIRSRVSTELGAHVTQSSVRRAKGMVKDKLSGNYVEQFGQLWDYGEELRKKNPGTTVKMVVNRVTPKSKPHIKRYYICFDALKRWWKEGRSQYWV